MIGIFTKDTKACFSGFTSLRGAPRLITPIGIVVMLSYGPIEQFPDYHAFADTRAAWGVPHAADVLSNIGFAAVGLWGLGRLRRHRSIERLPGDTATRAFFCALVLTAFGSAYYHLAPDNARLVWDRLPIALGCAALLIVVRANLAVTAQPGLEFARLLPAAAASVLWWSLTDRVGQGDLRPYLLLQALPLVLIPIWQAGYGATRAERVGFAVAIALYVAAKLAEVFDAHLFALTGMVSGHTLKHVLATCAAAVLVRSLVVSKGGNRERFRVPVPASRVRAVPRSWFQFRGTGTNTER